MSDEKERYPSLVRFELTGDVIEGDCFYVRHKDEILCGFRCVKNPVSPSGELQWVPTALHSK